MWPLRRDTTWLKKAIRYPYSNQWKRFTDVTVRCILLQRSNKNARQKANSFRRLMPFPQRLLPADACGTDHPPRLNHLIFFYHIMHLAGCQSKRKSLYIHLKNCYPDKLNFVTIQQVRLNIFPFINKKGKAVRPHKFFPKGMVFVPKNRSA